MSNTPASAYAIRYIWQATTNPEPIPPPDQAQAGQDYDTLNAIYTMHQTNGLAAARDAWQALKRFAPHLDARPRLYKADELRRLEIPRYALAEYPVYLLGMNVIVGARGAGKSFLALDIAAKVACAHPARHVIYTAGEGLASYKVRYEAWATHHKQRPANLMFYDGAMQPMNGPEMNEFEAAIGELKPIFIIIDTLARSMAGFSENDTTVMNQFVDAIETVQRKWNCGTIIVHHEGRNGHMRGSSALDGAADSVLVLKRADRELILANDLPNGGKNRHQEEAAPITLELLPVPITLDGATETSAVILPSEKVIHEEDEPLRPNQIKVLEVVEAYDTGATITEIVETAKLDRATVYRITKQLMERGKLEQDKVSKRYRIKEAGA